MNLTISSLLSEVMPYFLSTGLPISTCDIQQPSGTFDAGGAPTGNYTPVAGLQGLVCMSAPESMGGFKGGEVKSATEILGMQYRHVLLGGYYPQIPEENANWQAVVDGVTWDLISAESDSQHIMTRIELKQAEI